MSLVDRHITVVEIVDVATAHRCCGMDEFAFWSRVEGRGSRVTSRGSRVNGRGSRVNGRG